MIEQDGYYHFESDEKMVIEDEAISKVMEFLMESHPHKHRDYTWDDIGTATLMSDAFANEIRYCPQQKQWYMWKGRWKKQATDGTICDSLQTLLNLLRYYCDEVAYLNPEDESIESYKKYINSLRKNTAMKNILAVLANMVRMDLQSFDNNPFILNTTNYAYDLRTGEIVHEIGDYNITMRTTTRMPDFVTKPCKRWFQFIDEIMSGDKEKARFLQRALGYSMLGTNREECMFIAYGSTTRNGKGTLFNTITAVLGEEYANAAPTSLICESKNGKPVDFNAPQPVLSRLVGTRLVSMAESPRDVRLDSAAMKTMTGRDTLVTRGLFENSFSFVPQFTLWLNTNYLPAVTDDTVFSSNRIWVIEFNEHFGEDSQDKDLKDLFRDPANKPTILKWLMDGCLDYWQNGLQVPACVRTATAEYKRKCDRIGRFIEERCEVDYSYRVERGALQDAYKQWCFRKENGFKPLSPQSLATELEIRNYHIIRSNGNSYYIGLRLKEVNLNT